MKGMVVNMFKCSVRVMALVMTGALFLGFNMNTQAAGLSEVLPSGGINAALAKGTTLENMQAKAGNDAIAVTSMVAEAEVRAMADMQQETVVEEAAFLNPVVADVNGYVNIRSAASENSKVLGKFYDESVGELLGIENGWCHIQSGSIDGYVKASFCVTGEEAKTMVEEIGTRLAVVACDGLYVRKEASKDSDIIRMAGMKDELLVLDVTEDWVKVDVEEGFGWVAKEYVELKTEYIHAESKEEERIRLAKESEERELARKAAIKKAASDLVITGDNEMGVAVAEYAIQFVGNPYKWGGTSLTNGADCSGFVMKVYEEFGVSLPHSSAADRRQGSAVSGGLQNAQPGDLICYSGHVALYIGDGKIVHAASEKSGIKISKADYRKILAIRRIF